MADIPQEAVRAVAEILRYREVDASGEGDIAPVAEFDEEARELLEAAEPHRDEHTEQLKQRAELAENAIVRCVINIKTAMNLTGEPPPNPSEWDRGYWACANLAIGAIRAPYVDTAIELIKQGKAEADAHIARLTFPKEPT